MYCHYVDARRKCRRVLLNRFEPEFPHDDCIDDDELQVEFALSGLVREDYHMRRCETNWSASASRITSAFQ